MARILVVDDEDGFRLYVAEVLTRAGHLVEQAVDGADALRSIERQSFDVVMTDLAMPRVDGMDLIGRLRQDQPEVQVIVLTSHGSIERAVEAMRLGAFDFIEKPLEGPAHATMLVERALERRRLLNLSEHSTRAEDAEERLALSYGDASMEPVLKAIEKVAPTDATVLLMGESGTGKEVVARAIHRASDRAGAPFVAVNCAALPADLVESELFGHEKGAFTGAHERRRGRIELAEGGTFFLDEIGELRPEIQAKLLRVVQEGCVEHLGGTRSISVDVRWIAATNRDLQAMMDEGTFREDLYHRLALFPIRLPPLRDRGDDIVPLAEDILGRISRRVSRRMTLHGSAREAIRRHGWRGNVRELSNTLERAVIMADATEITADDLLLEASANGSRESGAVPTSFEDAERGVLVAALEKTDGNRREAAKQLGIAERTLYDKLKRYNVR